MDLTEKTLDKRYAYEGRIINLRVDKAQLPDGREVSREVVEHPGGVCVLPLTDDHEVLMVRQYRYPHERLFLEIPAGKLEKGEDPFECGKRELSEETGMTAKNYRSLGRLIPTPAYCGEIIYMYLATGLTQSEQHLDDGEFLEVEKYPIEKLVQMVLDSEIEDAKTQAAVLKTKYLIDHDMI